MVHRARWITTLGVALALLGAAPILAAQETAGGNARLTFTKDVVSILQENCQICHRPGGDNVAGMVAPMSLITYNEVRPWAKAIAKAVQARQMPPWDATSHTDGQFINERVMSDEDRATLVKWVETGAARGRPSDAPEARVFPESNGWVIGEPDLIVYLEEPYWVADDVVDIQPRFTIHVTEEMLPEPRWMKAIECKPDSEIVHHIFSSASAPAIEGHPEERFALASVAAGEDPQQYPEGFGNLLRAGTEISISLHYNKEAGPGTGVWDRSGIGIKFYPDDAVIDHKVTWNALGVNGAGNTWFEIPPGHPNWAVGFGAYFEKDTLLLSVHPHMHYRGKDFKYTAYYPDGTTEVLLDVPDYSFSWQTIYFYKEPKLIPAGTYIDAIAHFDNSESIKAEVPKLDIGRAVGFAAPSTDEMMIPYISYTQLDEEEAKKYRGPKDGTD